MKNVNGKNPNEQWRQEATPVLMFRIFLYTITYISL